jgi:hypothetical protein
MCWLVGLVAKDSIVVFSIFFDVPNRLGDCIVQCYPIKSKHFRTKPNSTFPSLISS